MISIIALEEMGKYMIYLMDCFTIFDAEAEEELQPILMIHMTINPRTCFYNDWLRSEYNDMKFIAKR
jgi:hypothetical protein